MKGHKRKCPRCHKNIYRTYDMGKHALSRLPPTEEGRVYWCPAAGGYHISSRTKAEVDRKRGEHL
jgi:hypothetical protein